MHCIRRSTGPNLKQENKSIVRPKSTTSFFADLEKLDISRISFETRLHWPHELPPDGPLCVHASVRGPSARPPAHLFSWRCVHAAIAFYSGVCADPHLKKSPLYQCCAIFFRIWRSPPCLFAMQTNATTLLECALQTSPTLADQSQHTNILLYVHTCIHAHGWGFEWGLSIASYFRKFTGIHLIFKNQRALHFIF